MPETLLRAATKAYWDVWPDQREAIVSRSGDSGALERTLFDGPAPILALEEAAHVVLMSDAERRAIPPVGLLFNDGPLALPCRTSIVVAGEAVRSDQSISHHPPGWRALQRVCELRNAQGAQAPDASDVRAAARDFSRLFWRVHAQRQRRSSIPRGLTQQTFIEARQLGVALADGPSLRNWQREDDGSLAHHSPGSTLTVRLHAGRYAEHHSGPSPERLEQELRETGISAALALHVVLGTVIGEGRVRLGLDDLLRATGIAPRTSEERRARRIAAARWVDLFACAEVVGERPGHYREHATRRRIELAVAEPLVRVTWPAELCAATEFVVEPSPWTERFRADHRILTSFGKLSALGEIPPGKPSGAWARAIGMALHQFWRERATSATVDFAGEENRPTLRFARPLTRQDLFRLFRPDPLFEDVLFGPNPGRAQTYWGNAIAILQGKRVIGHYAEAETALGRKGWQSAWLTQPLDIRPPSSHATLLVTVARRAKSLSKHAKPAL